MKSKYELLIYAIEHIGRTTKSYYAGHDDMRLSFETKTPQEDILNIGWIMGNYFKDNAHRDGSDFRCLDDIRIYLSGFDIDCDIDGEDFENETVYFKDIPIQYKSDEQDAKRYRWLKDNGYLDEQWWNFGETRTRSDIDQNIDNRM